MERLLTLVENGAAVEELVDRIKAAEKEKKRIEQQLDDVKLSNLSSKEIRDAKHEVQFLMENFETILRTASLPIQKQLIRRFVHSIVVNRETDTIEVYLRAIPTLKSGVTTTSTCIKVEKKLNRKVKQRSADKTEAITTTETGAAIETNSEVNVLTQD